MSGGQNPSASAGSRGREPGGEPGRGAGGGGSGEPSQARGRESGSRGLGVGNRGQSQGAGGRGEMGLGAQLWRADPGPGLELRLSAALLWAGAPTRPRLLADGRAAPLPPALLCWDFFLRAHLETLSWSNSAASWPDNQSAPSRALDSLPEISPGPFWGVQSLSPEKTQTSRGVH